AKRYRNKHTGTGANDMIVFIRDLILMETYHFKQETPICCNGVVASAANNLINHDDIPEIKGNLNSPKRGLTNFTIY
ncbi:MAG: hypothetical protein ACREPR_22720, partial [Brasilonema sp.]